MLATFAPLFGRSRRLCETPRRALNSNSDRRLRRAAPRPNLAREIFQSESALTPGRFPEIAAARRWRRGTGKATSLRRSASAAHLRSNHPVEARATCAHRWSARGIRPATAVSQPARCAGQTTRVAHRPRLPTRPAPPRRSPGSDAGTRLPARRASRGVECAAGNHATDIRRATRGCAAWSVCLRSIRGGPRDNAPAPPAPAFRQFQISRLPPGEPTVTRARSRGDAVAEPANLPVDRRAIAAASAARAPGMADRLACWPGADAESPNLPAARRRLYSAPWTTVPLGFLASGKIRP